MLASVAGITVSYYADTPSGGTIVLLAIAVFLAAAAGSAWSGRHARRHHPPSEHVHEHGPDCGHDPVPHGDHVDYLHDGHRHAAHGAHYDDH